MTAGIEVNGKQKAFDRDWDIVADNWRQSRGKVKARWVNLTNDQRHVVAGGRVELSRTIQEAYGISKSEAEQQIRHFEDRNKVDCPKRLS